MPDDSRQKYQLNITLRNGQAYQVVTHMPIDAVRKELREPSGEEGRSVFDGVNPFTDDKVIVELRPDEVIGFYYHPWHRPAQQPVNPRPPLVQ